MQGNLIDSCHKSNAQKSQTTKFLFTFIRLCEKKSPEPQTPHEPSRPSESFLLRYSQTLQHHTSSPETMESLLSLSFDYLSSFDGLKIKKGLRQLEGLLAQICLSSPKSISTAAAERRRSVVGAGAFVNGGGADDGAAQPKELAKLKDDPAFREFFKLQEGFEWNGKREDLRPLSGWDRDGSYIDGDNWERKEFFGEAKLMLRICWVYTVAIRLIACLERLLGKGSSTILLSISECNFLRYESSNTNDFPDGQNDLLLVSTLDLLQGILLIHPPSRSLFSREIYMNVRLLPPPTFF